MKRMYAILHDPTDSLLVVAKAHGPVSFTLHVPSNLYELPVWTTQDPDLAVRAALSGAPWYASSLDFPSHSADISSSDLRVISFERQ